MTHVSYERRVSWCSITPRFRCDPSSIFNLHEEELNRVDNVVSFSFVRSFYDTPTLFSVKSKALGAFEVCGIHTKRQSGCHIWPCTWDTSENYLQIGEDEGIGTRGDHLKNKILMNDAIFWSFTVQLDAGLLHLHFSVLFQSGLFRFLFQHNTTHLRSLQCSTFARPSSEYTSYSGYTIF